MIASAGQRTRYVLIQQVEDATAQFPQWITLAYAWMSRDDMAAAEQFASDQKSAFGMTEWHMAYREDMDPERVDVPAVRRLVYAGRTYDIQKASPMGWHQDISLITLARVG